MAIKSFFLLFRLPPKVVKLQKPSDKKKKTQKQSKSAGKTKNKKIWLAVHENEFSLLLPILQLQRQRRPNRDGDRVMWWMPPGMQHQKHKKPPNAECNNNNKALQTDDVRTVGRCCANYITIIISKYLGFSTQIFFLRFLFILLVNRKKIYLMNNFFFASKVPYTNYNLCETKFFYVAKTSLFKRYNYWIIK